MPCKKGIIAPPENLKSKEVCFQELEVKEKQQIQQCTSDKLRFHIGSQVRECSINQDVGQRCRAKGFQMRSATFIGISSVRRRKNSLVTCINWPPGIILCLKSVSFILLTLLVPFIEVTTKIRKMQNQLTFAKSPSSGKILN